MRLRHVRESNRRHMITQHTYTQREQPRLPRQDACQMKRRDRKLHPTRRKVSSEEHVTPHRSAACQRQRGFFAFLPFPRVMSDMTHKHTCPTRAQEDGPMPAIRRRDRVGTERGLQPLVSSCMPDMTAWGAGESFFCFTCIAGVGGRGLSDMVVIGTVRGQYKVISDH